MTSNETKALIHQQIAEKVHAQTGLPNDSFRVWKIEWSTASGGIDVLIQLPSDQIPNQTQPQNIVHIPASKLSVVPPVSCYDPTVVSEILANWPPVKQANYSAETEEVSTSSNDTRDVREKTGDE